MINGALPPNSIPNFLIDVVLSAITFLPVSVEPIIVSTAGILLVVNVVATSPLGPAKIFTTPAGKSISCKISPNIYVDNGDNVDGLIIKEQPAAKAGPSLKPTFNNGKFHAKYATATPAGFEIIL